MASMYDPIRDYLRRLDSESVTLTFDQINEIIMKQNPKKHLPESAYKRTEWWDNKSVRHTQCLSWNSAGWLVDTSNIRLGESITFIKNPS